MTWPVHKKILFDPSGRTYLREWRKNPKNQLSFIGVMAQGQGGQEAVRPEEGTFPTVHPR
jgi:hypothetical protein